MKIYHGSKFIVDKIIAKGSAENNDYGPAFYLTFDIDSAREWACKNNSIGFVNEYSLRNDQFRKMKILDLTDKNKYNVLNWISILMHFRELSPNFLVKNAEALNWLEKYYINVDDFDVIIGFRADDSYFRFPREFVEGNLAYEDLEEVYKLGNLGVQHVFISEKSVKALKFLGAYEVDRKYIRKYYDAVKLASDKFFEVLNKPKTIQKTYIYDLIKKDNM